LLNKKKKKRKESGYNDRKIFIKKLLKQDFNRFLYALRRRILSNEPQDTVSQSVTMFGNLLLAYQLVFIMIAVK
jgi:hypothetical protein